MKRVTPAIAKGIAGNKDTMIDALYPIMGGMISKYVTQAIKEMMESINKKIEQGLSFERIKRKTKAKLTGVSETELLLEEGTDARISSLFVIHKETSILIADAHMENKEIDDAHMVASMASAIKDFINDWIQHNDTNNEVQLLSYGNATLYIESAGSVFIIAFLDAEPKHEQRIKINTFFASIVKKYASFFQLFSGDDSAGEMATLSTEMREYLYAQAFIEKAEKKNPAKYIFIILCFLLFTYAIYGFNAWYIKNSLEDTVFAQTGEHISIRTKNNHLLLEGQVRSIELTYEIEKIIKRHSDKALVNHLSVAMVYLDERFRYEKNSGANSLFKIEKKLLLLEKNHEKSVSGLEDKAIHLQKELNASRDYLAELLKSTTDSMSKMEEEKKRFKKIVEIKNEIHSKLDKTFLSAVYYDKNDHSLDFRTLALFAAGETVYDAEAIQIVAEVFEKYLSIIVEYKEFLDHIIIEWHSDSSGLEEENFLLSKKRALSVKYYLQRQKLVKQYRMQGYIRTKAYGSTGAIMPNAIEDKNASRRIKITFSLDDRKILIKLGEIIDD